MRRIIRSDEFDTFYNTLPQEVQEKVKYALYALHAISEIKVVNSKLVKKLTGTDFYELRISMRNEWRVILLTIDSESFIECESVLLLNGFIKKSTKDYRKEIMKAQKILNYFKI